MSLTLTLMIAYSGLVWGVLNQLERNATLLGPGEIQLHVPGYLADRSIYKVINQPERIVAQIEQTGVNATPRLQSFGLVSCGENSAGAQILGIDLHKEKGVTTFHQHIARGTFLQQPMDVVLGNKIAVTLGAAIGSELVVVTQAADGSIGNDLYRITGILNGIGEETDRSTIIMSLDDFKHLFGIGDVATEIAVRRINQADDLNVLRDRIKQTVPFAEVKTWKELFPAVSDMIEIADLSIYILFFIIYIAASLIMLNTMLMSVFERIKELGIMMAIGLRPVNVLGLIMLETFFLSLCGILLGGLCGVTLSLYLTHAGLDLSAFSEGISVAGILAEPHWFAVTNIETVLPPIVFVFIVSFIAVLYPAIKACRLEPVDALVFQ